MSRFEHTPIPASAGIGLRGDHYREIVDSRPEVGFLEVHSENYFGLGGTPHRYLERIRADYPLSFHGVGMSLGSVDPLDERHLRRLEELIDHYQPDLVSEHISWSSVGGRYLNDLLPLPFTEEALRHMAGRIEQLQDRLRRQILVENISSYLQFEHSTMPEWEFVAGLAERSDCSILLDVNNIYVNSQNHRFDPKRYLSAIPPDRVREIHLAGHTVKEFEDGRILIDTHNHRVAAPVWQLYRDACAHFGPTPTLIEWDTDLPPLATLLEEAATAQYILEQHHARVA